MSWFYSGNPQSSPKDLVRYLIQDTNSADQLMTDEEIEFCLFEVGGNAYMAGANACLTLSGQFTGMAETTTRTIGGLSLSESYRNRSQKYEALAKALLRRKAAVHPPRISAHIPRRQFEVDGPLDVYVVGNLSRYDRENRNDVEGGFNSDVEDRDMI